MSWRYFRKGLKVSDERAYSIILSPVITEKSTLGGEHAQVTFKVAMDATKPEIKVAIEKIFRVNVRTINTLVTKGKVKRFKGHLGQRSAYKKAVVRLAEGQMIDVTTGL